MPWFWASSILFLKILILEKALVFQSSTTINVSRMMARRTPRACGQYCTAYSAKEISTLNSSVVVWEKSDGREDEERRERVRMENLEKNCH